jgi:hypothetical protein
MIMESARGDFTRLLRRSACAVGRPDGNGPVQGGQIHIVPVDRMIASSRMGRL